eukprot:3932872-Rhodomonas_salina.1
MRLRRTELPRMMCKQQHTACQSHGWYTSTRRSAVLVQLYPSQMCTEQQYTACYCCQWYTSTSFSQQCSCHSHGACARLP